MDGWIAGWLVLERWLPIEKELSNDLFSWLGQEELRWLFLCSSLGRATFYIGHSIFEGLAFTRTHTPLGYFLLTHFLI